MELKYNVVTQGLMPEILLAIQVSESVYNQYGVEMVITSLLDGKHRTDSKHYVGHAVDLRLPNRSNTFSGMVFGSTDEQVVNSIKKRLTNDFDVILESDHIHIEFDPKNAVKMQLA